MANGPFGAAKRVESSCDEVSRQLPVAVSSMSGLVRLLYVTSVLMDVVKVFAIVSLKLRNIVVQQNNKN